MLVSQMEDGNWAVALQQSGNTTSHPTQPFLALLPSSGPTNLSNAFLKIVKTVPQELKARIPAPRGLMTTAVPFVTTLRN